MPKAVILIPARNEAASIAEVVHEIRQHSDLPVVLIDDASDDDTALIARKSGAIVLPLVVNLGAWGAIQTGFRYALREGYDLAVTMDADGQHEALYIQDLLKPVITGEAGVSIGACPARGSNSRKAAWFLLKHLSGLKIEDITSGFRAYNRQAMELLAQRRATLLEYQDIGVLALLCRHNFHLVEIAVNMRLRNAGHSRVYNSWRMVAYYMAYSLILGMSKRCHLITGGTSLPNKAKP